MKNYFKLNINILLPLQLMSIGGLKEKKPFNEKVSFQTESFCLPLKNKALLVNICFINHVFPKKASTLRKH